MVTDADASKLDGLVKCVNGDAADDLLDTHSANGSGGNALYGVGQ